MATVHFFCGHCPGLSMSERPGLAAVLGCSGYCHRGARRVCVCVCVCTLGPPVRHWAGRGGRSLHRHAESKWPARRRHLVLPPAHRLARPTGAAGGQWVGGKASVKADPRLSPRAGWAFGGSSSQEEATHQEEAAGLGSGRGRYLQRNRMGKCLYLRGELGCVRE